MQEAGPRAVASRLHALKLVIGFFVSCQVQALDFPEAGSEFRDCPECPAMVVVPAGSFIMGSPPTQVGRFHNEGIIRTVTINKPFAVGKFEVTFDEWGACVRGGQCEVLDDSEWGQGRRPAIYVNWEQAVGYANWLSDKTGNKYRLLTEAEWEYAARAGLDRTYFFGLPTSSICSFANVYDVTAKAVHDFDWENIPCDDGFAVSAPVGSFEPNDFGLYDMLGNVWEWTEDCLNPSWRDLPVDGSAWLTGDCSERAYRGGSWLASEPRYLRTADRYKFKGARSSDLGFRVARTLP